MDVVESCRSFNVYSARLHSPLSLCAESSSSITLLLLVCSQSWIVRVPPRSHLGDDLRVQGNVDQVSRVGNYILEVIGERSENL